MENLGQVVLVKDINPGTSNYGYYNNSRPIELIEFNGKLYFSADDGENGRELWVSDGTTEGTNLFADLNSDANASYPSNFTEIGDQLYFSATTAENGRELWVSDGTTEGTRIVADIREGEDGSYPENFFEFNGKLYFSAVDTIENGRELWVSDGTTEGTQLVADIQSNTSDDNRSSTPTNFIEFNDRLYFTVFGDNFRDELWVSDGSTDGTQLVAEISSTSNGLFLKPDNFVEFNNKLYFSASDGENGKELWVSDGTTEGTQLIADINLGVDSYGRANSSEPNDLTVFNNELFFSADNGQTGRELFKLTFDRSPEPEQPSVNIINGTNGKDNLVGTDGVDQIDGGNGKDTLIGGAGDDSLVGGNGKDTLIGDAGLDVLTGGSGKDTFVIASGNGEDTIVNFELGSDLLSLMGLEFQDLSFAGNSIYAGDEILATLTEVDTENLTTEDFEFI